MNPFTRLSGFVPSPPGLERTILRHVPRALLAGTLLLALPCLVMRCLPGRGGEPDLLARIAIIDIYAISALVLYWTVVFTAALAAFIVLVMKGPAYVADAYALNEAEQPESAAQT